MVGRALSERVKAQKKRRCENERYQAAVEHYHKEQARTDGTKKLGLRPIAAQHKVEWRTLGRLVEGKTSMSAFNASKQKLTPIEENVLVQFIVASADRVMPLSASNVRAHADAILAFRAAPAEPVGECWVERFLERHHDDIQTHWSRPLATERAKALNPEAVKLWFELIKNLVIDKGVLPENIYGMDESGFPPSDQGVQRVIGRRGTKVQHKAGSANRENVTCLVTICADGTTLKPTVIFKGKRMQEKWCNDNVSEASIAATENGWTDGGLAFDWVRKDFDAQTREKAAGRTRVLLMDGHSSHYTADLLEYCLKNNIEVFGYPPHTTHALQGLDVVCFAKFKEVWKEEIRRHEDLHRRGVNKEDFLKVWGTAFKKAFTKENVLAAFEATGIHPFNPDVITPEQMKPAEATSTCSSFLLPQSSPVRAVMAAFRDYTFTSAVVHPDSPPQAGPSRFPGAMEESTAPSTPKRSVDPASNPDLPTPSKRMRLLGAGLGQTSASFLVTKARVTHLEMKAIIKPPTIERVPDELPQPDWTLLRKRLDLDSCTRASLENRCRMLEESLGHAQDRLAAYEVIYEGQNAQLILQSIGMEDMNKTLHARENRKQTERSNMFPKGLGRHLTNPESIQTKRALEDERKQKEVDKANRKVAKASKKAEKEQFEARWKEVCRLHEEAVEAWKVECARLRGQGVAVKNLPPKPKRALKASLMPQNNEESSDEESDEESESDQ